MYTAAEFFARLEGAGPDGWETEYVNGPAELDRAAIQEVLLAERPFAEWLALRFDAGEPGAPLPDVHDALHAVMSQGDGTPVDAFAVMMTPSNLVNMPLEIQRVVVCNSASSALSSGATWLAIWLLERAGLVSIVTGDTEYAWHILDNFGADPRLGGPLTRFSELRGAPSLEQSPWVKLLICTIWPHLGVRALPTLNLDIVWAGAPSLDEFLTELESEVSAGFLEFVRTFMPRMDEYILSCYNEEPLVRHLEERALGGIDTPFVIDELPEWFLHWTPATMRLGHFRVARQAGRLLAQLGGYDPQLIGTLVRIAARSNDLDLLREGFPQQMLDEFSDAVASLPEGLANALIARALNRHIDAERAIRVLVENLEELERYTPTPGGLVEHTINTTRMIFDEFEEALELAAPVWAQLIEEAIRHANRLEAQGTRITQLDIERAVSNMNVPPISEGFLQVFSELEFDEPALVRLLVALALRQPLADEADAEAQHYYVTFSMKASDAITGLPTANLQDLRLQLLDEVLAQATQPSMVAEALCDRVDTLRALGMQEEQDISIVDDLQLARTLSRHDGDLWIFARATSTLVRTFIWTAVRIEGVAIEDVTSWCEGILTEALNWVIEPHARAMLLQARAWIYRESDPERAQAAFSEALELLPPEHPRWAEVAAEQVDLSRRQGQLEEAVFRGQEALARVTSDREDVAILHLSIGAALVALGRCKEGSAYLEMAIDLSRGNDLSVQTHARYWRARAAMALDELETAREHLMFLEERREDMDVLTRVDISLLAADFASLSGDDDVRREHLFRAAGETPEEALGVGLLLEIALLDLESGRPFEDLASLLDEAIQLELREAHDDCLIKIIIEHKPELSDEIISKLSTWADAPGRVLLRAHLYDRAGEREQALDLLRSQRGRAELSIAERINISWLLMIWLPTGRERSAICEEVEGMIDRAPRTGRVRIDLAEMLWVGAANDVSVLTRARSHALRALEELDATPYATRAQGVLARTSLALLGAQIPLSSPSQVACVAFLEDELAIEQEELSSYRHTASTFLLYPGPAVHPEALALARRLIERLNESERGDIEGRLRWIDARLAQRPVELVCPVGDELPLDALPGWLIAIIHGESYEVDPQQLSENLRFVLSAAHARPDAADGLLAALVNATSNLLAPRQSEFLEAVLDTVQLVSRYRDNWPMLVDALSMIELEERHELIGALLHRLGVDWAADHDQTQHVEPEDERHAVRADYQRAVSLMESHQLDTHAPGASEAIAEARRLLEDVIVRARALQFPGMLFGSLMSLGNALRMEPGRDIERALDVYEEASHLDVGEETRATLWKVTADALLVRGSEADLRQAEQLLEDACAVRRGRYLAETLITRAQVALRHPDHDELENTRRASRFAMEAVRTSPDFGDQDGVIDFLKRCLSDLERLDPGSDLHERYRTELSALFPNRAQNIRTPMQRFSTGEVDELRSVHEHSAVRAFLNVRIRFLPPGASDSADLLLEQIFGETFVRAAHDYMSEHSLWANEAGANTLLEELEAREHDECTPGVLSAIALIRAHLVRNGHGDVEDVQQATQEALTALRSLEDTRARRVIMRELALVWTPNDHQDDPVRNFALASELLRECVELAGGEARAALDTLQLLARALRYTGRPGDLIEARRLYKGCVEREGSGADTRANLLNNLAEIESHMGVGGRLASLQASAALTEKAVEVAQSPALRMRLMSGLAWKKTQVALMLEGQPAQREVLDGALALFREVDESALDDFFLQSHHLHHRVCEGTQARLTGDSHQDQQLWREYIERLDPVRERYLRAIGQHNLAESLLFGRDYSREDLAEALELLDSALVVRGAGGDHRHRWESALCAGNALLITLMFKPEILPIPRDEALDRLREYQRICTEAARELGPGEELFEAAKLGTGLALLEPTTRGALERLKRSWSVMREASAFLLLLPSRWEREAQLALEATMELAQRFSCESRIRPPMGASFILTDEPANILGQWVARIQEPSRRYTRARFGRPESVSPVLWQHWRKALRQGQSAQVMLLLANLREHDAGFLSEPTSNSAMWRWLGAREGSVAISMHVYKDDALTLVMRQKNGRRETWALGLHLLSEPTLPEGASEVQRSAARGERIRAALTGPLKAILGNAPSSVLWSPGPGLRDIMPADIWGDVPVAVTTSLALPTFGARRRERSILVTLADPGQGSSHPALGSHGAAALERFESIISAQGRDARLLASQGEVHGHTLLGSRREVRDTPASARDLLNEAREHEVIVIIAHGIVESANSSSFLCIDAQGRENHLDLEALASEPESFEGATVILLSCESGRTGDTLFNPGGLAGTLIASGARCVIAPLIPVRLDLAVEVGASVLTALHDGIDPWSVLTQIEPTRYGDESVPVMGGPPPSAGARHAETNGQRRSFVAWVG